MHGCEAKKNPFQQHPYVYVVCHMFHLLKLNGKTKTNQVTEAWIRKQVFILNQHTVSFMVFFYSNFIFKNEIHFSSFDWIGLVLLCQSEKLISADLIWIQSRWREFSVWTFSLFIHFPFFFLFDAKVHLVVSTNGKNKNLNHRTNA